MYDFADVGAASKDEQIRAWAVDKAVESFVGVEVTDSELVSRASFIDKFVRNGVQSQDGEV